ncbi:LysR family transcriptional regulator [Cognatiyoonia sp. IB215182]|uniref:LysR family transcriptional regulator n=1 Tax=Cognatiyoonia sp. IB215182 TaxID=3097353 RepID=UPI002A0D7767|nr:LysR family transcriptional regulator [Cognatiyoonia sp. IB215182]MDX8352953.1 LysR family transcriptional regulator [Cognatiyoonia sp. IB215182]
MNWDAISFDWNQVRAFLATVEEGSFSGAARALKTTQPTIGRQISELETKLGVTLVERSVRGPSLTEAGRDLLDHVRAMGDAATLISMVATGKSQEVTGEVTVTATDLLSASVLPGLFAPLRETAPGIRVRIVASADMQNLTQREADIAIRHVRPEQPDLIARHVGDFRANLYATTSYLDRVGRPQVPRDVAAYDFVGNADPERLMAPLHNMGIPVHADRFVMSSESGVVAWELVKAGYGVSMQPEVLGDREPGMEKVLPDFPSLEFPIWLVTHRELQTSRRIRIVFDLLARGLAEARLKLV